MIQLVVHTSNGMQRWSKIKSSFHLLCFWYQGKLTYGRAKKDEPVIGFEFTVWVSIFVIWSNVQPLPWDAKLLRDMNICSTIFLMEIFVCNTSEVDWFHFWLCMDCYLVWFLRWVFWVPHRFSELNCSSKLFFWGFCCTLCRTMLLISSRFTCMACSQSISRPSTFNSYSFIELPKNFSTYSSPFSRSLSASTFHVGKPWTPFICSM